MLQFAEPLAKSPNRQAEVALRQEGKVYRWTDGAGRTPPGVQCVTSTLPTTPIRCTPDGVRSHDADQFYTHLPPDGGAAGVLAECSNFQPPTSSLEDFARGSAIAIFIFLQFSISLPPRRPGVIIETTVNDVLTLET